MKGIVVEHPEFPVSMVIPPPTWMPFYSPGTYIYARIKNAQTGVDEDIEGVIISFDLSVHWDRESGVVNDAVIYRVEIDGSNEMIEIMQDEIDAQVSETNDLDPEYHLANEGPVEEEEIIPSEAEVQGEE